MNDITPSVFSRRRLPDWDKLVSWVTRVFVWGLLFSIVYLLRSFFLLLFLTFIFAYIQSRVVERFALRIPNRTLRVVLSGLVFLGLIVAVGFYLVPSVADEAKGVAKNFTSYIRTVDTQIYKLADNYPAVRHFVPVDWDAIEPVASSGGWSIDTSIVAQLLPQIAGGNDGDNAKATIKSSLDAIGRLSGQFAGIVSAFLLSLLFSFLIVLDMPRLAQAIKELEHTKLKFIYAEVAESIFSFCRVLGRAFEAQFFIGTLNTCLTALGLWILGFSARIAFLAVIVFFCSFIPIAGVFISSVPICLVALQMSGFGLMFLSILLICIIHIIEAYILNPRIYGHHLRMNPVLVLIVLTIGGKLFGVWGLLLGLPACRYFFGEAIRLGDETTTSEDNS